MSGYWHTQNKKQLLTITSHNAASTLRQCTVLCRRFRRNLCNVLKHLIHQLASHGRAFRIAITPHLLRHPMSLLRIYRPLPLHPQIPLQPQQHNRNILRSPMHKLPPHYPFPPQIILPYSFLSPRILRVDQAPPVADVVAYDDGVGGEEGVVFWGCGVIEFETVGAVVHADVVDEGLV